MIADKISPLILVIGWAIFVAHFLYQNAVEVGGKSVERPSVGRVILSQLFLVVWGLPVTIFLAIWGGIFWW